jgi:hypothetical protein
MGRSDGRIPERGKGVKPENHKNGDPKTRCAPADSGQGLSLLHIRILSLSTTPTSILLVCVLLGFMIFSVCLRNPPMKLPLVMP